MTTSEQHKGQSAPIPFPLALKNEAPWALLWAFITLERQRKPFQTQALVSGGGLFSTRLRWQDGAYHIETIIPEVDLARMAHNLLTGQAESVLPARFRKALGRSPDLMTEALSVLGYRTQSDPAYQELSLAPAVHEARAEDFVALLGVLPGEYETAAILVQARVRDALRVMKTHLAEVQSWPTVVEKLRALG